MTKIALAGINSFALGPTGYVLAGRISFALHTLAERVVIFGGEMSNFNAAIENILQLQETIIVS